MNPLNRILLLLVPCCALAALVLVASGGVPYKVYIVHTGSMTPTIPSKSAVIVREDDYRIGQAITFVENGEVVTHRLISISAGGLTTTKGDANRTDDPWHVPKTDIIGGVVAAPRQLGYWLEFIRNPAGITSILLSVLVAWQIWSFADVGIAAPRRRGRSLAAVRVQDGLARSRPCDDGDGGTFDVAPTPLPWWPGFAAESACFGPQPVPSIDVMGQKLLPRPVPSLDV